MCCECRSFLSFSFKLKNPWIFYMRNNNKHKNSKIANLNREFPRIDYYYYCYLFSVLQFLSIAILIVKIIGKYIRGNISNITSLGIIKIRA